MEVYTWEALVYGVVVSVAVLRAGRSEEGCAVAEMVSLLVAGKVRLRRVGLAPSTRFSDPGYTDSVSNDSCAAIKPSLNLLHRSAFSPCLVTGGNDNGNRTPASDVVGTLSGSAD